MNEKLVRKAKKGDKEAFSQLIEEVKKQSYKIAYCYLNSQEDSLDAVCDAIEKAFNNIKKLNEPKFFKTWFIRIVINECKKKLREKERVVYLADEIFERESKSGINDGKLDLENLLKELPQIERLLIYMKYYLGYTLEEISNVVDLPEGTVKSKIYNNLKKMKIKLEVREG